MPVEVIAFLVYYVVTVVAWSSFICKDQGYVTRSDFVAIVLGAWALNIAILFGAIIYAVEKSLDYLTSKIPPFPKFPAIPFPRIAMNVVLFRCKQKD